MINLQQSLEESELAFFWEGISNNLPKSIERSALGDEKIFLAFKIVYPKIREHVFKAGQQDMLERVREIIKGEMNKTVHFNQVEFLACDTLACGILKALYNLTK